MLFPIVAVVVCVAAGIFIQRNRELARSAPLRSEIQAQVCFETVLALGRTCTFQKVGLPGTRGHWYTVPGQARLTVGTDAFMISAPRALIEYAFTGRGTSIALAQMRSGRAGGDWIVITGRSDGRQVKLAIMPDNQPDAWDALAGTGAMLVPPMAGAMPRHGRTSRWLDRRPLWQFALLWWAGNMATYLVTQAAVAVWHGGGVHGIWLLIAVVFSTTSTAITVWFRSGAR